MKTNKLFSILIVLVLLMAAVPIMNVGAAGPLTVNKGNVALSGGFQTGNFPETWDLTAGDMTVSFTYDANGLVDDAGAHAWAELGIRDKTTSSNFNPNNKGVWLATDYDWTANTFDPDITPNLDLDDKLGLQKVSGNGEGAYDLPFAPPAPGNNHRFWWDRDGVDPWQNDETANTAGVYNIVMTFHATSATTGTAFMTINGLNQGFETDGNWNTIELTPAGMTFSGDMTQLQVFYGIYGYGATHNISFKNITVQGFPADLTGPITSNVVATPNPAAVGSSVTATAIVDDTTTGGWNIASAEYSLDNGATWSPMAASDGVFDEVSENVTVSFAASGTPGIYDLCVRGTDVPGNVGDPECTMFVVYDPSGGFVTGGGWIWSPAEAMSRFGAVWDQNFSTDASGWFGDGITIDSGVAKFSSPGGQYSRFDGYRAVWPGTYTAEIDVYLDPSWPADQGFDYSVASNGSDGLHQRDFIFHVGTVENYGPIVGKELLVAVDNNAYGDTNPFVLTTRPGGYYVVPTAGWYTLQHVFYDAGGYLAVDFNILDSNGNVVWSDTRSDTSDTIPGEVGGNRYAWFAHIDVAAGIQVDNHQLFMDIPGPEGKATFGFVSKYKKGATVPDGNTEFQFKAGDLNFSSTSYEWLVVTGGNYAKFKGVGTINGQGNYKFMIWAGDGSPDTFRIKIWYEDAGNEIVVYDNGMDQSIGGGSIVVHNK